jgi:hypothetical protein
MNRVAVAPAGGFAAQSWCAGDDLMTQLTSNLTKLTINSSSEINF